MPESLPTAIRNTGQSRTASRFPVKCGEVYSPSRRARAISSLVGCTSGLSAGPSWLISRMDATSFCPGTSTSLACAGLLSLARATLPRKGVHVQRNRTLAFVLKLILLWVTIMFMLPRTGLAILAALTIGLATCFPLHALYGAGTMAIDVSDGEGHGPDEGSPEWHDAVQRAIPSRSRRAGALTGTICFLVVFRSLRPRTKPLEPGDPPMSNT